jgi:hypothetical protein
MRFAVIALTFLFPITAPAAGERQLCNLEPLSAEGWHYRTKIDGRPERCWYMGERMKPRRELFWAESPAIAPPMLQNTEFEKRWQGTK